MRMKLGAVLVGAVALGIVPARAAAQSSGARLAGTWRAETPDGPRSIVIRPDSSASFGEETVRWRVVGDSIHIAFGDEWMVYAYDMRRGKLTVSGGDLEEPVILQRTGDPSPRPDSVPVPPPPPIERRASL